MERETVRMIIPMKEITGSNRFVWKKTENRNAGKIPITHENSGRNGIL